MFEIFAPTNIKIPFGLSNFFLRRAGAGGAILFRSAASSGVRSGGLCRVPAGQAVSCGRSQGMSAKAAAGGRRVSAGGGFRRAAGGGTGSVMRPEPGHVDGGCRGGRRAGGRQRSTGWRSPGAARYIRSGTSIPSSDMPRRITRATCCTRRRRMARFAASSSRRIEWSW